MEKSAVWECANNPTAIQPAQLQQVDVSIFKLYVSGELTALAYNDNVAAELGRSSCAYFNLPQKSLRSLFSLHTPLVVDGDDANGDDDADGDDGDNG